MGNNNIKAYSLGNYWIHESTPVSLSQDANGKYLNFWAYDGGPGSANYNPDGRIELRELYEIVKINPDFYIVIFPDVGERNNILEQTIPNLPTDIVYHDGTEKITFKADGKIYEATVQGYYDLYNVYKLPEELFYINMDDTRTWFEQGTSQITEQIGNLGQTLAETTGEIYGTVIESTATAVSGGLSKGLFGDLDSSKLMLFGVIGIGIYLLFNSKDQIASVSKSGASATKSVASVVP